MAAQPRRIVVGFDGSEGARRALDAAAQLMGYGSTVTVVSVVTAVGESAEQESLDLARGLLHAQLVTANYVRRVGDPADELVDAAREVAADVIVVGRRGPDESNGGPPGSVSADVVRRAHCDVLVVG